MTTSAPSGWGRTRSGLWTVAPSGRVTSWSRIPKSFLGTNRTLTLPMGESTTRVSPSTEACAVASPDAQVASFVWSEARS